MKENAPRQGIFNSLGTAYDGLYYVKSATHSIKRGEYKQSFELSRNGLISTIPRVPA